MSNISEGVVLEDLDTYFEDLDCSAAAFAANGNNSGIGSVNLSGSVTSTSSCCVSQLKLVDSPEAASSASAHDPRRRNLSNQRYYCALCDLSFDSKGKLRAHTRRHGAAPFQCRLCRQQFPLYYKLLLHTRRAHAHKRTSRNRGVQGKDSNLAATNVGVESHVSPSTSNPCNSDSVSKYAYESDNITATIVSAPSSSLSSSRETNISNVSSSAKNVSTVSGASTLQPSISTESPVDPASAGLSCDRCGRTFRQACTLRRHRRLHAGDGRFTCDVCGRRCISGSDLRRHLDTHQSHKLYVCPICSRSFKLATSLALHSRLHSSAVLQCTVCNRQFDRRDSLTKHMDTHKTERDLICDICGRRFKQQRTLAKHRRVMHPSCTAHK